MAPAAGWLGEELDDAASGDGMELVEGYLVLAQSDGLLRFTGDFGLCFVCRCSIHVHAPDGWCFDVDAGIDLVLWVVSGFVDDGLSASGVVVHVRVRVAKRKESLVLFISFSVVVTR